MKYRLVYLLLPRYAFFTRNIPNYMSLQSAVYRLSSPAAANPALVSGALAQLNTLLSGRGFGLVKGTVGPELLAAFNADLVVVRDSGHSVRGVYLRLSKS